jgi:hypothetical protein
MKRIIIEPEKDNLTKGRGVRLINTAIGKLDGLLTLRLLSKLSLFFQQIWGLID